MIRHLVFLRLPENTPDGTRDTLLAELRGLADHIDGMGAVTWHRNISVEGELTRGYTDMFEVEFRDEVARDAYLPHPEHQRVGGLIVAETIGGIGGVFVCDVAV